ncbi:MAG: hypothetical protein CBD58_01595, partial [bacterium TMED198]
MQFQSINPYTEKFLQSYDPISFDTLKTVLNSAEVAFRNWKAINIKEKLEFLEVIRDSLVLNKEKCSNMISNEMGKVLKESESEIDKCVWLCDYYLENSKNFLIDRIIPTDSSSSYVKYEPLGIILGVMPWNFPFWQVFRFAIPSMLIGNVVVLKHAPNVIGCSILINDIFNRSGIPKNVFNNIIIENKNVEKLIASDQVRGVSFTGSDTTGKIIGGMAGKNLKPMVLELGGSDPFIVFDDAVVDDCVEGAISSRFLNSGQSCIAAKRFIIHNRVYDDFKSKIVERVEKLKVGNPLSIKSDIGPLARKDLVENINCQVSLSIDKGAKLVFRKNIPRGGFFFGPTVLENVEEGMPVFDQEVFGPILSLMRFNNTEEAISLANKSMYGLGASVWSACDLTIDRMIRSIESGMVFVNEFTKSDP